MRISLKIGLPVLLLLLLGSLLLEGPQKILVLIVAMGVAMWVAFSLPHPGRTSKQALDAMHEEERQRELESLGEEEDKG